MVDEETGCCGEQAFYVAFLLQSDPRFTKSFLTYIIMHSDDDATQPNNRVSHNFLLILHKEQASDPYPSLFSSPARSLLNLKEVIIADPWRNKVYASGIRSPT